MLHVIIIKPTKITNIISYLNINNEIACYIILSSSNKTVNGANYCNNGPVDYYFTINNKLKLYCFSV